MWQLDVAAATYIGLVRSSHQDTVHVDGWSASTSGARISRSLPGRGALAVIDGMGGQPGGAMASRVAGVAMSDLQLDRTETPGQVNDVVQQISNVVHDVGLAMDGHQTMGATIAGLVLTSSTAAIVFNVGDCSIYRLRGDNLGQLAVIDRIDRGGGSSFVTQSLGGTREVRLVDAHAESIQLDLGDLFIVCTDGLTDSVSEDALVVAAGAANSAEDLVAALASATYEAGAPDNVSIIVARVREQ